MYVLNSVTFTCHETYRSARLTALCALSVALIFVPSSAIPAYLSSRTRVVSIADNSTLDLEHEARTLLLLNELSVLPQHLVVGYSKYLGH